MTMTLRVKAKDVIKVGEKEHIPAMYNIEGELCQEGYDTTVRIEDILFPLAWEQSEFKELYPLFYGGCRIEGEELVVFENNSEMGEFNHSRWKIEVETND